MYQSKAIVVLLGTVAVLSLVVAAPADEKKNSSVADGIAWGKAVNGLQLGVSRAAGDSGQPATLFDGSTLRFTVQVRNAGDSSVRFIPSTFGCAAAGAGGGIPITKLVLTPVQGGEPITITDQGTNHLSEKIELDADDVEYYATQLASGQTLEHPHVVQFSPGEQRSTRWQRTGKSNFVPAGKYLLKAEFVVGRRESPWKGELTSGSLEVEFHQADKR